MRDNMDLNTDFIYLYETKLAPENYTFGHNPRQTTAVRVASWEPPTQWRSSSPPRNTKPKSGRRSPRTSDHPPRSQERCFNCQRTGHRARECRSNPYCSICREVGHRNEKGPRCTPRYQGPRTTSPRFRRDPPPNTRTAENRVDQRRHPPRTKEKDGRNVRVTQDYGDDIIEQGDEKEQGFLD